MHITQVLYQMEGYHGCFRRLECDALILAILHRKLNIKFPYYANSAYLDVLLDPFNPPKQNMNSVLILPFVLSHSDLSLI